MIAAFTEDQVARLSGVSVFQLRNWEKQGLIKSSFGGDNKRLAYSRLYSFRDVASLQVLSKLRNEAGCTLRHLKEVKRSLAEFGEDVWCKKTLFVLNKKVLIKDEGSSLRKEVVSGQIVLEIPLRVVQEDLEVKISKLNKRDKDQIGVVSKSRSVAHSRPVMAGTRIPVRSIQTFANEGYSVSEILQEYPTLTKKDVMAAIAYKDSA